MNTKPYNARSDAPQQKKSDPGIGDDVPCVNCGAVALDTGLECSECGFDNWPALTNTPPPGALTTTPPTKETP